MTATLKVTEDGAVVVERDATEPVRHIPRSQALCHAGLPCMHCRKLAGDADVDSVDGGEKRG